MERVRKYIDHMGLYAAALLKWIVVGGLVGGVGGVVGALFHLGVNYATEVRLSHPWVLYLLPVGGLIIAGLYKLCRLEGKGTNAIIESVHFGSDVPLPPHRTDAVIFSCQGSHSLLYYVAEMYVRRQRRT